MRTQLLKAALCACATSAYLLSAATPVWAEGSQSFGGGSHGVNRVIRTAGDPFDANSSSGYIGARGDVSISFSIPTDAEGIFTEQTNPYDNKPSAYLGAQGPLPGGGAGEVDAGYQFETGVHPYNNPDGSTGYPLIGWTPFVSQGDNYLSIRVYDTVTGRPTPWRSSGSWSGSSGSMNTNMEFAVTLAGDPNNLDAAGGGLKFTESGLGTVYWNQSPPAAGTTPANNPLIPNLTHPVAPWRAQTVFDISKPERINVKRVTAMTRRGAGGSQLDGSSMSVTFSKSSVRKKDQSWIDWALATTRQTARVLKNASGAEIGRVSASGYDAPGNGTANNGAWDKRVTLNGAIYKAPSAATIVEFPNLKVGSLTGQAANIAGREDDAASRAATQGGVSRYNTETVNINLGTATLPTGKAVEIP